jgi:hypothetical protein
MFLWLWIWIYFHNPICFLQMYCSTNDPMCMSYRVSACDKARNRQNKHITVSRGKGKSKGTLFCNRKKENIRGDSIPHYGRNRWPEASDIYGCYLQRHQLPGHSVLLLLYCAAVLYSPTLCWRAELTISIKRYLLKKRRTSAKKQQTLWVQKFNVFFISLNNWYNPVELSWYIWTRYFRKMFTIMDLLTVTKLSSGTESRSIALPLFNYTEKIFEVFMEVTKNNVVFWYVTPYSLVCFYQRFRETRWPQTSA